MDGLSENRAASRMILGEFSESILAKTAADLLHETGGHVTCAIVFISAAWKENLEDCLEVIQVHGHVPIIIGCSAAGLIGLRREAEQAAGISMLFLNLPQTRVIPFSFDQNTEFDTPERLAAATGAVPAETAGWILLADPLSLDIESTLRNWNAAFPGVPILGGLASGGSSGEDIFLVRDREQLPGGGVALGFCGGVKIAPLVSQGCQPIGEPFTITGASENVVTTLGSKPAFEVLSAAFNSLPEDVREHAQGNVFAGLAASEYRDDFKRGDFLIRNILGADPNTGAVAIGAFPRVGQTLQYQLRNRDSAHAELITAAERAARSTRTLPFARLLFSCLGRGRSLFGEPDHDPNVLAEILGDAATAGFFCNGEIGPVADVNFVHGYTASAALFTDA